MLERVDARLAALRKDWAWVAERLNESPQTLNNWRHHRGIPSAKQADFAALLDWTVEQLHGKEATPIPGWPFETIPLRRVAELTRGQRLQVEGVLMDKLDEIEGAAAEKQRMAATERDAHVRPHRHRKTAP